MTSTGARRFSILTPQSVDKAVALRAAHPGSAFSAGLTALQLGWESGGPDGALIDIRHLPQLDTITETAEGGLRIGALARLETIRLDPAVQRVVPALAKLLGQIGGLESRLHGTIGGNLGWASGDLRPLLLACDARLLLAQLAPVPVDAPLGDALILGVEIPSQAGRTVAVEKVGARAAFSPAIATVAVARDTAAGGVMTAGGGLVGLTRLTPSMDETVIAGNLVASGDGIASAEERCAVAAGALAALWRGEAETPQRLKTLTDTLTETEPEPENTIVADPHYLTDRLPENHLVAATLRSPHAHAEIVELDVSAAVAWRGWPP